MALREAACLLAVLLTSCVISAVASDLSSSILFIDNQQGAYLRNSQSREGQDISPLTATASVAALLGVGLPSEVDETTAKQLESVLAPNAFKRPRTVFAAIVPGLTGDILSSKEVHLPGLQNAALHSLRSPSGSLDAAGSASSLLQGLMRLPGLAGGDVKLSAVGCTAGGLVCGAECLQEELQSLASTGRWVYTAGGAKLTSVDLPDVVLDLSQGHVAALGEELACMLHSARSHVSGPTTASSPPSLLFASISSLQALQEQEGVDSEVSRAAALLTLDAVSQTVLLLQKTHNERLAAAVALLGPAQGVPLERLGTSLESARSVRKLQDDTPGSAAGVVKLVEKVVLWSLGIILVVATIMGVFSLVFMPLTKDTLLYTSAKLD